MSNYYQTISSHKKFRKHRIQSLEMVCRQNLFYIFLLIAISLFLNGVQRFGYEAWRFSESVSVHRDTTPNEEPARGNHRTRRVFIAIVSGSFSLTKFFIDNHIYHAIIQ